MCKKSEVDKTVHTAQVRILCLWATMALLNCYNPLVSLPPSTNRPSPWRPPLAVAFNFPAVFRSRIGPSDLYRRAVFVVGGGGRDGALTMVRAGAETDAAGPGDGGESVGESGQASVPVEKLPLESKVKEMTEQRLRMRMAKKIRLRRKRLVRKRRLRKKGRWPPSKMKKLKNV